MKIIERLDRKIKREIKKIKKKINFNQAYKSIAQQEYDYDVEIKLAHVSHFSSNWGDLVLNSMVEKTFYKFSKRKIEWKQYEIRNNVDDNLISELNSFDGVIVGGGGLFIPDSNKNEISGWQWSISNDQLDMITPPISLFAVGYNYFRGQKPKNLFLNSIKKIEDVSHFMGLRNNGSIKAVDSLINKVTGFQPCPTTIIGRLDELEPITRKTKKVGINIPYDRYERRYGKNATDKLIALAEGCRILINKGYRIYVISHVSDDRKFSKLLKEREISHKEFYVGNYSFKKALNIYRFFDLVIGGRGHAQMIPFGLFVPILSLDVHDKISFFLEDIDKIDWLIHLDNIKMITEEMVHKSLFILDNKNEVQEFIKDEQKRIEDVTKKNVIDILNYFE